MLVVVGGHSRNIGKTAVTEGIIRALPQARWTAVKITQYGNDICSEGGHDCDCASGSEHPYVLTEETAPSLADSGRYLAAGAARSYWLRTRQGNLAEAMPALRALVSAAPNAILESNSVLNFVVPDLYIQVLDYAVADMKDSSRRFMDRADAFVLLHSGQAMPWAGIPPRWIDSKACFPARAPAWVTPELAAFVSARLRERVADNQPAP